MEDPKPTLGPTLPGSQVGAQPTILAAGSEPPHGEVAADGILATLAPERYHVEREIARGGMGRILRARDRRLGRPVAIKELLVGSDELRARFQREARITAKLQHPAIVSLLEAGSWPSGEPFYVMKLVAGQSLDRVIAQRSTLAERLGLLPHIIAAADALAYAHGEHVIHRDLKPANVLVGDFGETVVIDWGLAKDLTDANAIDVEIAPFRRSSKTLRADTADATQDGSVLGTPAYMPPEQAHGEAVDERADVYALGAMLYHVLAGAPPYSGRSAAEVLDAVASESPRPLTARTPGMPADLVTIISKAMARSAGDRYPSAKQLVEDLKKFQTGQLVGAHQYTAWQLLRRWLRRYRTPVVVASVAIVLLGVLGAASMQRIVREQTRADHLREVAEHNRADAEDLSTFMLGDLGAKLEPLGQLVLLDDVAKKAVAYYDSRAGNLSELELGKLALAERNLGDVLRQQKQGDLPGALRAYVASLALAETLVALAPTDPARRRDVAASHDKIADIVFAQGHAPQALDEYRAARAIREELVAAAPTDLQLQRSLGDSHDKIGGVISAQGDSAAALAEYRAAEAIRETVVARDPGNRAAQRDLEGTHGNVGDVLLAQADAPGALAEYRAGLSISQRMYDLNPHDAELQRTVEVDHSAVGNVLFAERDIEGALIEYRASLAFAKALADRDPTSAIRQADLAVGHNKIGNVLLAKGDTAGALAEYRADEEISRAIAAEDPTNAERQFDLSVSHNKVGNALLARGDATGALAEYGASLAITEALAAKDPTNADQQRAVAISHNKVGDARATVGDHPGALAEYRQAAAIITALAAKDPTNATLQVDLAVSHQRFGDAFVTQKNPAAALHEYEQGLAIARRLLAAEPTNADAHELVDVFGKSVATLGASRR